jgi:probable HAF family extracellular repeat protein
VGPEADHRPMTMTRDGTVYAIAHGSDPRIRALRWTSADPAIFAPLDVARRPRSGTYEPVVDAIAGIDATNAVVTLGQFFSGAYMGITFEPELWAGNTATRWRLGAKCPHPEWINMHAFGADGDGVLALTLDPSSDSPATDPSAHDDGSLPSAAVTRKQTCSILGHGIATAVRGDVVVGYLGYLDSWPAPMNINLITQQMHALRWNGTRLKQLGNGVPFAVARNGFAAGATALPGHATEWMYGNFVGPTGEYRFATPHAMAWDPAGHAFTLLADDARSVAWDISDDGTIVGMEQTPKGRHYAFRWRRGRAVRLDDLPHPAGWRFESAYAIGRDGTIAGIGTYRGIATAFRWHE